MKWLVAAEHKMWAHAPKIIDAATPLIAAEAYEAEMREVEDGTTIYVAPYREGTKFVVRAETTRSVEERQG